MKLSERIIEALMHQCGFSAESVLEEIQQLEHKIACLEAYGDMIEKERNLYKKALKLCNELAYRYGDLPPKVEYWLELAAE